MTVREILSDLVSKLGTPKATGEGKEYIFSCVKCRRKKLYVNPFRKVFFCFYCDMGGKLDHFLEVSKTVRRPLLWEEPSSNQETLPRGYRPLLESESRYGRTILQALNRRGMSTFRAFHCRVGLSPWMVHRAIFPIESGKVRTWVARAVPPSPGVQVEPKELSGPAKSRVLYNYRDIPRGVKTLVVVEGIFDAEAVFRAGFHAVALLGSRMSRTQASLIQALDPGEVVLFPDGDRGGKTLVSSCVKALRRGQRPYRNKIRVVYTPKGKDPDDLPSEKIGELIEEAFPISHVSWVSR